MPVGEPWSPIAVLLHAKQEIRTSAKREQDLSNIDSYWADLVQLLRAFVFLKTGI
jgi:hypothetical protein